MAGFIFEKLAAEETNRWSSAAIDSGPGFLIPIGIPAKSFIGDKCFGAWCRRKWGLVGEKRSEGGGPKFCVICQIVCHFRCGIRCCCNDGDMSLILIRSSFSEKMISTKSPSPMELTLVTLTEEKPREIGIEAQTL